ncbi:hypothetical protein [uncultured Cardiobacterium sp.]|uniref:hypothetical protein n=1 Tax=uncultured Cardiobacterium sp. TaxID=417619 RepID=UPI0026044677|nr:hypothetical protein [uncultured Cardiobacterium sp.]
MKKHTLSLLAAACLLAACGGGDKTPPADPAPAPPEVDAAAAQQPAEQPIGGEKDAHGCLPSAGQTWSTMRNECVQIFDIADIQLIDPANDTLAVYVILSPDKKKAEVFAADLPDGVILNSSKGGYKSKDGKVSLSKKKVKGKDEWTIRK